jgi:LPXTG-site transpeptidase (sortase) family protein
MQKHNKLNHNNYKRAMLRIAILAIVLTMVLVNTPVQGQTILLDGPYQTRVSFQSVTPSPSFIEQPLTISILVESLDPLGGIPQGTVEIKTGVNDVCEITLDAGGEGSCVLAFDTPAVLPLQAFYIGTDTYLPAASTTLNHQVWDKFHPVVTIESDTPDPSVIDRIVRVESSVSSLYTEPATGDVSIYRSASGLCSPEAASVAVDQCDFTLDTAGEGSCDLTLTAVGVVDLCAVYSGDVAHYAGVSISEKHTVSLSNTFIEIVSINSSPSVLGESVTVNYVVTSPDGTPQSGLVTILNQSTSLCSASALTGSCSFSLNQPNQHILYATYAGELDGAVVLQPSVSDPVNHLVLAPPTAIHLSKMKIDAYREGPKVVSELSADDPNPDDQFTFSLVSGGGDEDNQYFSIRGDQLIALGNILFDDGRINIRLRVSDQSGLYFEESFRLQLRNNLPELPATGFAPKETKLNPKVFYKTGGDLTLIIPVLNLKTTITGVPITSDQWDTSWLAWQVGWLHGSAFPGWRGNAYLAGHNYLSSGLAGPFLNLGSLKWGDQILVQTDGSVSVYEVRSVQWVNPQNNQVLTHEEEAWLTLVTCDQYDEKTDSYRWRIVVRAVLVDVQ